MSELPPKPTGWAWANLGEFADVKLGKMLSAKARESGLKQLPYLRNQNVRWGFIDLTDVKSMGFKSGEIARYSVQPGDLLVCEGGEPARCAVYSGPAGAFMYQKALHRIRPNALVAESRFLQYCLWHFARNGVVLPRPSETTIRHIPLEEMQALQIPLPPIAEQRRIVEALDAQFTRLDAAVAALERVRLGLERYRGAVLQAAVDGRLGTGLRPSGWPQVSLGDLLSDIETGRSFKCIERPPEANEVGVVKVSAVTWGEFDSDESKTCADPSLVRPDFYVKEGDFLFSRANTINLVGACVIVRRVTRRLMLSDKILRFRLRDDIGPWILLSLRSRAGRTEIERLATGNQESMRNIGQERIRQIRIRLPPKDEQARVLPAVDLAMTSASYTDAAVAGAIERASALRASILRLAFEGRLVSQDPHDESASVLLDRIRASRAAAPPTRKRTSRSPR